MSPSSAPAPPASARRGRWKHSDLSTIVLEARYRVGGRGLHRGRRRQLPPRCPTLPSTSAAAGCIRRIGIRSSRSPNSWISKSTRPRPPWREQGFDAVFPPQGTRRFHRSAGRFLRPRRGGREKRPRQRPPNSCLEAGNRWNPMIDAISTYVNGAELDQVSILDMDAYEDTGINWRVRRGFGLLVLTYGAPCPRAVNTQGHPDRSFRQARADRDIAGHAFRRQGDRHRADQSDRR